MADDPQEQRRKIMAAALLQKVPSTQIDPTGQWLASLDEAAREALSRAPQDLREYGGGLYLGPDGRYSYSVPVTGKDASFTFETKSGPSAKLAGIYHTHPKGFESKYFSPGDIDMANQLKIASYIKILENGDIRKFVPGQTATKAFRRLQRRSEGEPLELLEKIASLEAQP